jgi:hypothetical protein
MKTFKFEKVTLPELQEYKRKTQYYLTNQQDNFYIDILSMYEHSSIHSSIVKNFAQRIVGSGMEGVTELDQNVIDNLDLNKTLIKIALDWKLYGGYALEIIWNITHTQILQINHVDFSKVRCGGKNEQTDEIDLYYYSNDWTKKNKNLDIYPKFDITPESDNKQLLYVTSYSPGNMEIYPRPNYYATLEWIYVDIELANYYSNLVKNNFVANTIISLNNGVPEEEVQKQFESSIKSNFTSSDNAGSIVVLYNDNKDNAPEIIKFNEGAEDGKYEFLMAQTTEKIISGHQLTHPLLAGIKTANALGSSGEELKISETIYNSTVIHPNRSQMLESFNGILQYLPTKINYEIKDKNIFTE